MDKLLLKLSMDAHTEKEEFLNFGTKPLKCMDGWQKLTELFNKAMNPYGAYQEELKTVTKLGRGLDLLKEKFDKVRSFFMFLSFIFIT